MAQQRAAIDVLTQHNLQLSVARLGAEFQTRAEALAAACARDERLGALARVSIPSGDWADARRIARAVRKSHPVAAHVFVVRRGVPVYPPGHGPLLADVSDLGTRPNAWAALVARAEALEGSVDGDRQAAALYRRAAAEPDASPRLQALALARVARCEERLGHDEEVDAIWARLQSAYGDERDLTSQPYELVAALERSGSRSSPAGAQSVRRAYDDLLSGRWVLAADQVDYLLPLLEHRLGRSAQERPTTRFLDDQRFAATLRDRGGLIRATGSDLDWAVLGPDGAYPVAFLARMDGVTGCAIDTAWLSRELLSGLALDSGLSPNLTLSLEASDAPVAVSAGASGVLVRQPLAASLAPLQLVARGTAPQHDRLGAWAFAGATVVTIGALAIGMLLLLRDAGRQRETARIREDLVSGVSHELKTPLTLIRVYAETLEADPDSARSERLGYYQIIVRESERLGRLIDRVLSVSRVDHGQRSYRFAPTDLGALVGDTAERYAGFLRARGFRVAVSIAPDVPPVACDREAIAEALVNLLDNATKYSGDKREVLVRLSRRDETHVLIEVADRGIGIPASELPHVFDRFYRGGHQSGRGGYGLGLFLVKHTTDAHGGRVEVESVPGEGSLFRLVLPVYP
jgi:signal transduction histidine kinase